MIRLLAPLLLATALCTASVQAQGKTVTMVADEWCPFNCAPDSEKQGYFVELARRILEPHGYKVEYKIVPWARAIEEVRAGKYNILIAASHEETPDFLFPAADGLSCGFSAYTRYEDPFVWRGVESVKNKRIGGIKDYVYSEEINAYIDANPGVGHKIQIIRGDNALATNIKKLLGKRLDVMFENPSVLGYRLKEMEQDLTALGLTGKIRNAGAVAEEESICHLGFGPSNNNKEAVHLVSEGVKQMEANGELAKLKAAYQIQ